MNNKREKAFSLILLPLLIGLSVGAGADVYRWTDSNGNTHFGDRPPAKDDIKALEVELSPTTKLSLPSPSSENFDSDKILNRGKKSVVMYATSWCQYCQKARNYFRENKIRYVEYDVEKKPKRMREFKRFGGKGYP
ncbi:DUF4124 domain-containing protein [Shewanella atlantica]|uniref:DUF4124 domain-containing protein n=2 Tax=Shewanella TaxID=22 RepID=UPI003736E9CA